MEQGSTDTTQHDAEHLSQGETRVENPNEGSDRGDAVPGGDAAGDGGEAAQAPHSAPGTGGGTVTNAGEATAAEQDAGGFTDGEHAGPYGGAPVED